MTRNSPLNDSLQYLKNVGTKRAEAFSKIGINTVGDLLYFFPSRYLDRSNILQINQAIRYLHEGFEGEFTFIGKVIGKEKTNYGKKEFMKVFFKDNSSIFECVWFQGIRYFEKLFNENEFYAISGKLVFTKFGHVQIVHPDFDKLEEEESKEFTNTGKIIPFYRVPKELKKFNIGDLSLRKIIKNALEKYSDKINDFFPESILATNELLNLPHAIFHIHYPSDHQMLNKSLNRFKFEEMFFFELLVALRKRNLKTKFKSNPFSEKTNLVTDFIKGLPFELTTAQKKVIEEIRNDLSSTSPMNRLLQGDVGSGKTIVALIAMLIVIDNGYQTALLVPTEILADQHFKTISSLLKDIDIKIELLIGGTGKKSANKIIEEISSGRTNIVIGTHAIIEDKIIFKDLGLVIIDEQHRFGVKQRSKLITKGILPHTIVMTATPIPRTLSMTVYGDLDVSIIDELPKNRKKIITAIRGEDGLAKIYDYMKEEARKAIQSFIVYPLVEDSDKLELKAAETFYDKLNETVFNDLSVGLLHGRMTWQEKEEIMYKFASKEFDILVSTTVIEVGIDIPNANIIVINDAHRFGLAQLHQLRGRVGRGNKQAYCILVTKNEYINKISTNMFNFEYLSDAQIEKNKTLIRLNAMAQTSSGFELSEIDLKLRGPGDIFGTKQSGLPELKITDISKDQEVILKARAAAFSLIDNDPHLNSPTHSMIREKLLSSYKNNLSFSKIA